MTKRLDARERYEEFIFGPLEAIGLAGPVRLLGLIGLIIMAVWAGRWALGTLATLPTRNMGATRPASPLPVLKIGLWLCALPIGIPAALGILDWLVNGFFNVLHVSA